MDATARIASFVLDSSADGIPPDVLREAKTAILDSLGVALAGSLEPPARICAQIAREESLRDDATVIGRGYKSSAIQAAFANGAALHALDFDLSFGGLGQPTAPILPAALAVAEWRGANGRDLINAFVAGFEVAGKLGASLGPGAGDGWHSPGIIGVFGAAMAAAKLMDLNESQLRMALGMTCSLAGGVTANFGTMSKPLHVAVAARDGVTAAKMAGAGFTSNAGAIEGRNGYYALFFKGHEPNAGRLDELGKDYHMISEGLRLKPYPCGGLTHAAIDATLALRAQHTLEPGAIESVDVLVPRRVFQTIAFKVPRNETEGKFCMPYLIARTIIDGRITLDTFTDEAIEDEAVLSLASRVEMRTDEAGASNTRPSEVTIKLRNGESLHSVVQFARGGLQSPLSQAEVEAKFIDCASRAIGESSARLVLHMVNTLEGLADVRQLGALLAGRP